MTDPRVENGALEVLKIRFRNVRGVQALWT